MTKIRVLGLLIMLLGLVWGGFWVKADRESRQAWQPSAGVPRPGAYFFLEQASLYFGVETIGRPNSVELRRDRFLIRHRITGHALLGLSAFLLGLGIMLVGADRPFLRRIQHGLLILCGITLFVLLFIHPILLRFQD
jgi:hypothetical protein